jgi:hypothetical protein
MWDVMMHPIPEVKNAQLHQHKNFKTYKLHIFNFEVLVVLNSTLWHTFPVKCVKEGP